ncbi:D-alanyl-D-alanine carboxypeptidase [Spirochaetia bacterium]|nr:D-alanyl-D-alanine carboxypeptidase [Spirochaetia bacterium]
MSTKQFLLLFCTLIFGACTIFGQEPAEDAPELGSRAAVLLDAATGTVLYAKNPDEPIPPASLTKLMTIHIALTEAAAGRAAFDEIVPLPRESWAINQPPRSSLMFLAAGQTVTLKELLLGLAIPSGNDAAVAVALRFAPSVKDFTGMMNDEAQRLGMNNTFFVEPSGVSENNITTAMDFAVFCSEYVRLHPETLSDYHSVAEFAYPKAENVAPQYRERPGTIVQYNHNNLLGIVEGVDGLKTGYIDESGYNIALSAMRMQTRLIAVILGAPAQWGGDKIRDADGTALLEWGFRHFQTLHYTIPSISSVPLWKAKNDFIDIIPASYVQQGNGNIRQNNVSGSNILEFTTYTGRGFGLRWETRIEEPLIAPDKTPLGKGTVVGNITLYDDQGELRRIDLLTADDIEPGGFWKRLWHSIRLFFKNTFSK